MDMTLAEQIRRVLIFTGKPLHPEDIRRLVFDNRPLLRIEGKKQSIRTFKNVMQEMPDVISVYDNKNKTWKRKLTRKTHEECFNDLIKRVRLWLEKSGYQIAYRIKDLIIRLMH